MGLKRDLGAEPANMSSAPPVNRQVMWPVLLVFLCLATLLNGVGEIFSESFTIGKQSVSCCEVKAAVMQLAVSLPHARESTTLRDTQE